MITATPTVQEQCVTAGDDALVRLWDLTTHRVVMATEISGAAHAACFSPDGQHVAVGIGSRAIHSVQRTAPQATSHAPRRPSLMPMYSVCSQGEAVLGVIVMRARDLHTEHEVRSIREGITDIKYSVDGTLLAASTVLGKIYILSALSSYHVKHVLDAVCSSACLCAVFRLFLTHRMLALLVSPQHSSAIVAFDFSLDGAFVQSTAVTHTLAFHGTSGEGAQEAAAMADVEWVTHSCTLTWGAQGLWPDVYDGAEFTTADCSNAGAACVHVTPAMCGALRAAVLTGVAACCRGGWWKQAAPSSRATRTAA
jgi:hypothetical protein